MVDVGFPQVRASKVYCDNFGTTRKADSNASDKKSLSI